MNFYRKSLEPNTLLLMGSLIKKSIIAHIPSEILDSLLNFELGYVDYESLLNASYLCVTGKQWNKLVIIVEYLESVGDEVFSIEDRSSSKSIFKIMVGWPIPNYIFERVTMNLEQYQDPFVIQDSYFWTQLQNIIN